MPYPTSSALLNRLFIIPENLQIHPNRTQITLPFEEFFLRCRPTSHVSCWLTPAFPYRGALRPRRDDELTFQPLITRIARDHLPDQVNPKFHLQREEPLRLNAKGREGKEGRGEP